MNESDFNDDTHLKFVFSPFLGRVLSYHVGEQTNDFNASTVTEEPCQTLALFLVELSEEYRSVSDKRN